MAELNAKFSIEQKRLRVAFNLEQTTIPAIFKINAAGTTWGSIAGNIQNQTDLYAILQDKASVESVENLAETVQNNYDTLDAKIDDTESVLAGQITALSDTVNINNQNINNRVDTVEENASNLTDTVSDNYTELDGKISDNSDAISTINNTISGYGDIVTHNVNEFATAAQGDLADTALQPDDNISELNNDVGYITSASLPTVNNGSLTIQKNGSNIAVFTANDAQNITANITVPTQASDIEALPDSTTIADLTTQAQLNAINSGATATNIGQITTNQNNIADIRDLIPSQATSSNQLADKAFVNSSINNGTLDIQVNGASIGTFTANQSGNTTANITIPDEVFLAQYGSTTAQEIAEALSANKIVMMIDDNKIYHLSSFDPSFFYFSCLNNQVSNYIVFNGATWSRSLKTLENTANKVTSLSATSTDTQYPSAKCVYDELQSIASSIPTVGNGTITFTQGGVTKGTITTNQSGNATIDFDAGGSGSSTWGSITGTLSNQTDLQNALNAKVSKSGDTMTGQLNINRETGNNFVAMRSGMVQRGTKPTSLVTLGFMEVSDKNGQWLGKNQFQYTTTGEAKMELSARSVTTEALAKLSVGFDSSNRAFATAPATSTARTNSTDIITRGFLNSQGYITGITSSDVTTALGYTPLSNATKYGSSLSYSSNVLQLLDQDGNALGGSVTIQSSLDIDNKSITTNLSDELQTVGVIDQNNTTNAIKTWTGTKAQYDAIVTKDANTLYICTNGEIYLGTTLISNDGANKSLSNLDATGQAVIDSKADVDLSNCTKPHIVETYVNGASWYRIYSDKWCEQGGKVGDNTTTSEQTVNLLKPYTNTNYSVQVTGMNNSNGSWGYGYISSSSQIKVGSRGTEGWLGGVFWMTCGYIN